MDVAEYTRRNTMTPKQIPFELSYPSAFAEEDFLIAPPNEEAVMWVDRWPDWPAPLLVLYGKQGCGKTHLSHIWQKRSDAGIISNENDLERALDTCISGHQKAFILEDVNDDSLTASFQETLFHLYNLLKEKNGALLITTNDHPKKWALSLSDLRSRILSCPAIQIRQPDDQMLTVLLVKQFDDRQIEIAPDVVKYLLPRIERSFTGVHQVVRMIDQLSLSEKRPCTVPLARQALLNLKEVS